MTRDRLIASINALLDLDARKALAPHGIGGLARELLEEAKRHLAPAAELPPMPATVDRRPFIDVLGNDTGYLEGDGDWAAENHEAVTWLIDNHVAIRAAISK